MRKNNSNFQLKWMLIAGFGLSFCVVASAEEKTDSAKKTVRTKAARPQVLNYEADIIEGEKKRPELFLQTNTNDFDLMAIIYLRKNFNDFHAVDKNRRPQHLNYGSLRKP